MAIACCCSMSGLNSSISFLGWKSNIKYINSLGRFKIDEPFHRDVHYQISNLIRILNDSESFFDTADSK